MVAWGRMFPIIIRAGTIMTRRVDGKSERARKDHTALGLASTAPDGSPCWSIRRGGLVAPEYWWVALEDVAPEDVLEGEKR